LDLSRACGGRQSNDGESDGIRLRKDRAPLRNVVRPNRRVGEARLCERRPTFFGPLILFR
jgi:hypothetical protein